MSPEQETSLMAEVAEQGRLVRAIYERLGTVANQTLHLVEDANQRGGIQRTIVRAMNAASVALDLSDTLPPPNGAAE